jgi:hypothetical protein
MGFFRRLGRERRFREALEGRRTRRITARRQPATDDPMVGILKKERDLALEEANSTSNHAERRQNLCAAAP